MRTPLLLVAAIQLASCGSKKDDDKPASLSESQVAKVEASQALWLQKKAGHSAYSYTTGVAYEFGKKAWATTVGVERDKPTCRTYEHKELVDGAWKTTESWTENQDTIGLNPVGFGARTMDQLYTECISLLRQGSRPINLEFFEDGILKGCYTECTDTCYSDIHLTSIQMDKACAP